MIWAALLAGIAGYVDAICFLRLGHAFAANMTGNLVEIGLNAAQREWLRALWYASMLVAFLLGVLATRLVLHAHRSPRRALFIEAAIIGVAASGALGGAAVPVLAAAMAIQNEAVTHGVVGVNVAFVTGDIQQLGERLVGELVPSQRRDDRQPRIILTVLCCYVVGAAIGTLAAGWNTLGLLVAAAVLAGAAALPERFTRLTGQRPGQRPGQRH